MEQKTDEEEEITMQNADRKNMKNELEKYPVNFQQALLLIAAVLRRIKAKRLDKGGEKSFINEQTEGGETHEN